MSAALKRLKFLQTSPETIIRGNVLPIFSPTISTSYEGSRPSTPLIGAHRLHKLLPFYILHDNQFSRSAFKKNAFEARESVIKMFNNYDESKLEGNIGNKFLEACRETHRIGASMGATIQYISQSSAKDSEIVYANFESRIEGVGSPTRLCSEYVHVMVIDVNWKCKDSIDITFVDEDGKIRHVHPDLLSPMDVERTWRFERLLYGDDKTWKLVDIVK